MDRPGLHQLLSLPPPPPAVDAVVGEATPAATHTRTALTIAAPDGDTIPAFLLLPLGAGPFPAVIVHHQHNGEWHLGKSEVAGLAGDPRQAFGPALAALGIAVLCGDVTSFEDRRARARGIEPHADDWLQHYNAMAHRLIRGELLLRKVLSDAQALTTYLLARDDIDPTRVGVLGHSLGGTITQWHAAIDERLSFACASGSLASLARRVADGTGINMLESIPGIANQLDLHDVLGAIAPRRTLIVSSTRDRYSADATDVVARAEHPALEHQHFDGEHALDDARFDAIVTWVSAAAR